GQLVKRGDPTDSEYITLAPGESMSAEADISRLYPIQLPGEYIATLNLSLHDAFPAPRGSQTLARCRAEHEDRPLEPTSVTFVVEPGDPPRMTLGQSARLSEQSIGPTHEAFTGMVLPMFQPVLIGGTEAQRRDTRSAHAHAVYMVAKALAQLNGINPSVNFQYQRWFGANTQMLPVFNSQWMTYDVVIGHFASIRSILNFPTFPIQTYNLTGAGCKLSTFGYTYSGARTIWLCSRYWPAPIYGAPDSKFGTLIHEWSHAVCSTSDFAYGTSDCINLASSEPRKAVLNGDSHEYFVEFV
ncbi:MAG: M35 family metallo-endopeptidase, partial [Kofleriaceae bacterium]